MKTLSIIVAAIVLNCWCHVALVRGDEVLDTKEIAAPHKMVRIAPVKLPAVEVSEPSVAEPVKIPVVETNEPLVEQPVKQVLVARPRILIAENPITDNVVALDVPKPVLISKLTATKVDSVDQPQVLPVAIPIAKTISQPTQVEKVSAEDSAIEDNFNLCASMMCPMIYCENSLPAIPSQGICCTRCVTNPNCNASACPKYKCGTYLIPANFTAGECCDRCAPASNAPTTTTKKPTTHPGKTGVKPKKSRSSSSSEEERHSASSSSSSERSSSSSEEFDRKPCLCNLRHSDVKHKRSRSRLLQLLSKKSGHFRHSHSRRQHDHFQCSHEDE